MVGILVVMAAVGLALSEPTYIGSKKCKMCHKTEYASWEALAHSKAFDRLKPEEQGKAECLKCHATNSNAEMPGVGCESCHGPGSDYKGMKVMKDHDASVAAGLIVGEALTALGVTGLQLLLGATGGGH